MIQIDISTLVKRLNPFSRQALEMAATACMSLHATEITVGHVLIQMLAIPCNDLRIILEKAEIDVEEVGQALAVEHYATLSHTESYPAFSPLLVEWLRDGWLLASAEMQSRELRGGVLLLALLHSASRYVTPAAARLLTGINRDRLQQDFDDWVKASAESVNLNGSKDDSVRVRAGEGLLARYAKNMTEDARSGRLDPVLCRDNEIDLMIDILCRRRKNNPVIVGEAGVGKSALVEGLALRIIAGQVPDKLKNTDIMTLDIGALQAGASVKGEFEKRFKGVMAEVNQSPVPVTRPSLLSEKLDDKARYAAQAEPQWRLLNRLGHEFELEDRVLEEQKDKGSVLQAVYSQLTELHRYLLAIQNAPSPGKSALKAVQLRLDHNSTDPIFATRQMAKTLPSPLNRWVDKLADQAWHVVMIEAVHYMELDWRDTIVNTFNSQLANKYPFNPRSKEDVSLDAFERFFKTGGLLDTFYQQNLKLFVDNSQGLNEEGNVIIREDVLIQLHSAQKIRDIFFSSQNGMGTQFAVETVGLSGNKRRSVLNLDGQLVDYAQGRNYTAHLVWPNNMREGNESKLTLVGINSTPRSITFSGPWAQFRLFDAGQLTNVQDGSFTARFSVDGGTMTYRIYTDTLDNPFAGGLFSHFRLPDTLY
jgi:hypothetical protein